ncbi:DUF397 domain-containing protein [Streptomyces sp. NPDC058108]|uniref:DUF397 domain-containing protein n=1 Tax=Streptomyces TaxID=1883 RepID=UPI0036EFC530
MSIVSELVWFKSSYGGSEGDECVEAVHAPGAVQVCGMTSSVMQQTGRSARASACVRSGSRF